MVAVLDDCVLPIPLDMTRFDSTVYLRDWDRFLQANTMADKTRQHYMYAMLRLMSTSVGTHVLDLSEQDVVVFLASLLTRSHGPPEAEAAAPNTSAAVHTGGGQGVGRGGVRPLRAQRVGDPRLPGTRDATW
jgi:hypothetical protein